VARKPEIREDDAERALKVLQQNERGTGPSYRQPSSIGAYLMLLIALAIVGVIVYQVLNHKEQVSRLWYRATHPGSAPAPVQHDQ
jgi:hypothetical protein